MTGILSSANDPSRIEELCLERGLKMTEQRRTIAVFVRPAITRMWNCYINVPPPLIHG